MGGETQITKKFDAKPRKVIGGKDVKDPNSREMQKQNERCQKNL